MWHDDNDYIMKLLSILEKRYNDPPFPASCPICGAKSGHIYMHRYDKESHGALWIWCSSCHSFSHSSYKIPDWWINPNLFTIFDLHAVPDNLDEQAASIDDYISKLLAVIDDKTTTHMLCEQCGAKLEADYPEGLIGTYSLTCPNCGWGLVTTYCDPIVTDPTVYQIILLEGNDTSVKVIKAVNQVSHLALSKARQSIENAPQVIFTGDALEVHDMKEILDKETVLYKIEPDYPYNYEIKNKR